MAYSLPDDIRNVLAPGVFPPEPPDPAPKTNTAADLSDEQLQVAIDQAGQTIDAYIGNYYATPVAATEADPAVYPEPIKTWSVNIAAYLATLTYRRSKDLSQQDPVALRYGLTMQQLNGVNSGKLTLPIPPNTGDSATSAVGRPVNSYSGNLFDARDFDLRPGGSWPWEPPLPGRYPGGIPVI